MLDSDSYASCTRVLALFFMKISVSGDLNEEYRDELVDELMKALDLDLSIEDNLYILPVIKEVIADLQELKMMFKLKIDLWWIYLGCSH